jgi:single-strand DNA-binding protein
MNNVILIGNLCKDVKLEGSGDKQYTKNSIAVKDAYNKEQTDFINIIAFSHTAKFITSFFEKGQGIAIVGRIKTGSYEKDGKKIYTTDVIVKEAYFNGSKKDKLKQDNTNDGFPPDEYEELPF